MNTATPRLSPLAATDTVEAARAALLNGARDLRDAVIGSAYSVGNLPEGDLVNLLRAYVALHDTEYSLYYEVQLLVAVLAERNPIGVYSALVEVLSSTDCDPVGVALVVSARSQDFNAMLLETDVPGLFSREVHAALFGRDAHETFAARTAYLDHWLEQAGELSSDERSVGHALATDWDGALSELVETTRALCVRAL